MPEGAEHESMSMGVSPGRVSGGARSAVASGPTPGAPISSPNPGTALRPQSSSLAYPSQFAPQPCTQPEPPPHLPFLAQTPPYTPSGLGARDPSSSLPPHLKPPAPRWAPPCGNCPWRRRGGRDLGDRRPGQQLAALTPHPPALQAAPSLFRHPPPLPASSSSPPRSPPRRKCGGGGRGRHVGRSSNWREPRQSTRFITRAGRVQGAQPQSTLGGRPPLPRVASIPNVLPSLSASSHLTAVGSGAKPPGPLPLLPNPVSVKPG